jgi:hypothetical protein
MRKEKENGVMIFLVYQVFESRMYFRATTEGKLKCTLDTFCLQFTINVVIFDVKQ